MSIKANSYVLRWAGALVRSLPGQWGRRKGPSALLRTLTIPPRVRAGDVEVQRIRVELDRARSRGVCWADHRAETDTPHRRQHRVINREVPHFSGHVSLEGR
jgi:hypothetical protein